MPTNTAIFPPLGSWGLVAVAAAPDVTVAEHAVALAFAIVVHAGLALHVLRRARMLRAGAV